MRKQLDVSKHVKIKLCEKWKNEKNLFSFQKNLCFLKSWRLNFCRRDFSLRETGFSPSFHEVALINYSLVSRARLFSLPLTRGPWNRRSRRRSRRPRQPFFFHEEEEESARGWARAVQTLNGQVFTEGRPGRVLSYRHRHLFSMPISVAHAPVGPTARNPQRRGERKRERARKREGER